jgi:hypothetical protein
VKREVTTGARQRQTGNMEIAGRGGEIVLYRGKDGRTNLDVRLEQETVWLTQAQMATLFATERSVITKHIGNILKGKELDASSVCAKFAHTAADGKTYQVEFFNLDAILSVGYRVNSTRGTQFRIWATQVLREHILQGYTLNEQRLKAEVARLSELRNAVDVMGRILSEKAVSGDEAQGLLRSSPTTLWPCACWTNTTTSSFACTAPPRPPVSS